MIQQSTPFFEDQSEWSETSIACKHWWSKSYFSLKTFENSGEFLPGQFVEVGLVDAEESVIRPLSLVNVPGAPYEFFISIRPHGRFSQALAQKDVGDRLWIHKVSRGQLGVCVPSFRKVVLACTGTGISPYLSLLRSKKLFKQNAPILLLYGIRNWEEGGYIQELLNYQRHTEHALHLFFCVSQEESYRALGLEAKETKDVVVNPKEGWVVKVYAGRVTSFLKESQIVKDDWQLDRTKDVVFLCGNVEMVKQVRHWLLQYYHFRPYTPLVGGGFLLEGY